MRVTCSAVVEDPRQRENLCVCIDIIGAEFTARGSTVYADFNGDEQTGKKLIDLFNQYLIHGISILG